MLIFVSVLFILSGSTLALKSKNCLKYKLINSLHEELIVNSHECVAKTKVRYFERKINSKFILGHAAYVGSPDKLELLEPGAQEDGCKKNTLVLARETSMKAGNCEIAMNAGFHRKTGHCMGNVISKGKVIQISNFHRRAHFGIKKSGTLYFGYPTVQELNSGDFRLLVGGIIWMIRRSKNVINESISNEFHRLKARDYMKSICNITTARSVIGVTRKGEIVMITVGGRNNEYGINLYQLADVLLTPEFDFAEAINVGNNDLTTLVVNNTLVTLPSGRCSGESLFVCEKPVSTVLCVRNSHDNNATSNNIIYYNDNSTNMILIILITFILILLIVVVALILFQVFKISKKTRVSDSIPVNKVNDNTKYDDMLHVSRQQ